MDVAHDDLETVEWYSSIGDWCPLAKFELWREPFAGRRTQGCSTQWEAVRDALDPRVDMSVWPGGVRAGKTAGALAVCVADAMGGDHPAVQAWLALNDLPPDSIPPGPADVWICSIGSNDSLRVHRRDVMALLPKQGVHTWNVGNKGEARIEIEVPGYARRAVIWFRSVQQGEDAFQGATVRRAMFDEELHDPRWKHVVTQTSLRVGAEPVKIILCYAPKHGRIWVDDELVDQASMRIRVHRWAALDNPHVTGEARAQLIRTLAALSDHERLALGEGRAVPREGLIWPQWSPALHVVDAPEPSGPGGCPEDWPRYTGVDYGYGSGNVVLWGARSPGGVLFVYRELYTVGWTARANGLEAARLSGSERLQAGWGDSSRPEAIAEFRDCGIPCQLADKSLHGLSLVGDALLGPALLDVCARCSGRGEVDGGIACVECEGLGRIVTERAPPTVVVVRGTCPRLRREIPGYVWAPGRAKPLKRDDHASDAFRYLVVGVRGTVPPDIQIDLSFGHRSSPWRDASDDG